MVAFEIMVLLEKSVSLSYRFSLGLLPKLGGAPVAPPFFVGI